MEALSTEERIKQSALKEFAQYGFEGARVDRIAKKAKVNKAMIYYHFKCKENLYESMLLGIYSTIVPRIIGDIQKDVSPKDQLENIVNNFIDFLKELDEDFIKVMLRELSTGGKYFKKLMLPKVFVPMIGVVEKLFADGIRQGLFKPVVSHYSFLQMIGAIIFPNALRIILSDTDIGKVLFKEDFFDGFRKNLLTIVEHGILVK